MRGQLAICKPYRWNAAAVAVGNIRTILDLKSDLLVACTMRSIYSRPLCDV